MAACLAEHSGVGLDPAPLAARAFQAIREDALYAFTHPEVRAEATQRFAPILAAMDRAAAE